jgi:hypothetical protein
MINDSLRGRNGFKLMMPVKRRWALVATNPLRNSRPELIANDGKGVFTSGASYSLARTRPERGTSAQVYKK